MVNLDARLNADAKDKALLSAYLALVESRLAAATSYYTWVDRDRFTKHTRDAYGAAFPTPLNYILPWLWRRQVSARMTGYDDERVMLGVADAYGALAARLADGGGKYFFGNQPSSLDAVAFAQLAFHAHSPVGDAMRGELKKHPALVDYVNNMQAELFPGPDGSGGVGGPMGPVDSSMWLEPPELSSGSRGGRRGWGWSTRRDASGGGPGAGGGKKKQRTAKEIRFRRRSRYAVLIALGAVVSYLLLGEVVVLAFGDDDNNDDGAGGDDDDDDDDMGTDDQ